MNKSIDILYPVFAMVFLSAGVWIKLFVDRISEMKNRRISAQSIATAKQSAQLLTNTNSSDNFTNLFELPVLFYIFCLVVYSTQKTQLFYIWGAWAFVASRVIHSLIHCTHNNVMQRFYAYLAGGMILFTLWILLFCDFLK